MAKSSKTTFEPKIVGFLCQWCGYAGADLAGVSRYKYPPNLRVVRVLCSGRVDAAFTVDAFLHGADGVMVIGCHPGDCHYITGNYEAMNMAVAAKMLLKRAGVDSRRFVLDWVSASEGMKFSRLVADFTATLKKAGPLGQAEREDESRLESRLQAALSVARGEKMRYLLGMFTTFTRDGNRYGERYTRNEMERALEGTIADEFTTKLVLQALEKDDLSVKELAERIQESPSRVLALLMKLQRMGEVRRGGLGGRLPTYALALKAEVSGAR